MSDISLFGQLIYGLRSIFFQFCNYLFVHQIAFMIVFFIGALVAAFISYVLVRQKTILLNKDYGIRNKIVASVQLVNDYQETKFSIDVATKFLDFPQDRPRLLSTLGNTGTHQENFANGHVNEAKQYIAQAYQRIFGHPLSYELILIYERLGAIPIEDNSSYFFIVAQLNEVSQKLTSVIAETREYIPKSTVRAISWYSRLNRLIRGIGWVCIFGMLMCIALLLIVFVLSITS